MMRRHTGHPSWSPSLGFSSRDDFTTDRAARCPKEDSYRCHAAIWYRRLDSDKHYPMFKMVALPLSYVCIWHRHASQRMPVLFNCPRGGAEGVLVAAPGVANGPRTRSPRLGRPMLCLIELLPHESSHQGANWCSVACSIFLHVSSRIYRSSSGMSMPLRTSSFRCPAR